MVILARRTSKHDGPGFTLLELLLTVALLVGLLAAVVFNFAPLKTGAGLEEGGRQFESLIRFASAQAAQSGRVVQFRFDETATAGSRANPDSGSRTNEASETAETTVPLRVMREVDPVGQPGVFEDMPEAQPFLAELFERIHIEDVKGAERPVNLGTNEVAAAESVLAPKPPITFYPDGSSDTADIILSSRDPDDFRQMKIHLAGVTGMVSSQIKMFDQMTPIEWMDPEKTPEANATAEQSRTDSTETSPPVRNEISDEMDQSLKPQNISTNGFPNDDWP
jgi:type II secretory pathway pseudopilin PulG